MKGRACFVSTIWDSRNTRERKEEKGRERKRRFLQIEWLLVVAVRACETVAHPLLQLIQAATKVTTTATASEVTPKVYYRRGTVGEVTVPNLYVFYRAEKRSHYFSLVF